MAIPPTLLHAGAEEGHQVPAVRGDEVRICVDGEGVVENGGSPGTDKKDAAKEEQDTVCQRPRVAAGVLSLSALVVAVIVVYFNIFVGPAQGAAAVETPLPVSLVRLSTFLEGVDYNILVQDPVMTARVKEAAAARALGNLPPDVDAAMAQASMNVTVAPGSIIVIVEFQVTQSMREAAHSMSLPDYQRGLASDIAAVPGIGAATVGEVLACKAVMATDTETAHEPCVDLAGNTVTTTTTTSTATTSTTTITTTKTSTTSTSTTTATSTTTTTNTTTTSTMTTTSTATATSTTGTTTTTTSTTSTSTTTNVCQTDWCKNGGTCSLNASHPDGGQCSCVGTWGGDRCNIANCASGCRFIAWESNTSAEVRAAEYKAVADTTPFTWHLACGGTSQLMWSGNSFACNPSYTVGSEDSGDGYDLMRFQFTGTVPGSSNDQCANQAYSCAGPSLDTAAFESAVGDEVRFEYQAQAGGDYFEGLVQLMKYSGGSWNDYAVLVFSRGHTMANYAEVTYTFTEAATFKLRFHVGSYDWTGGTALGAIMLVKPFVYSLAR